MGLFSSSKRESFTKNETQQANAQTSVEDAGNVLSGISVGEGAALAITDGGIAGASLDVAGESVRASQETFGKFAELFAQELGEVNRRSLDLSETLNARSLALTEQLGRDTLDFGAALATELGRPDSEQNRDQLKWLVGGAAVVAVALAYMKRGR